MIVGSRIAQVIACTGTIPPIENCWLVATFFFHQIAFCPQVSEFFAIRCYKRTYPQHHFESHGMKFVDHSFRIWKFIRSEPEIGIVFLPAVIDHQYARGEPIVNNALRILQNVLLILIIYKLYPCVVLRL